MASTAEPGADLGTVDLIGWFATHGRDLPWRRTRDPWAVAVSELMLQQTQVARVTDRWRRFLDRFPSVEACAAAAAGDVIDEWAGLGYNRRALHLHRMATAVATEHGGRFPSALADLLALPGVGPYTARAIRVFAFELPDAVLDTNVARIVARTTGRTLTGAEAQRAADRAAAGGAVARGRATGNGAAHHWAWNQAVLDVGAGWCRPREPACPTCPCRTVCRWALAGRPDPDPAVGSAAVSGRQSRFEGSDRQGRGRLLDALRTGPVVEADLPAVMGWPGDAERAARVAATVVADGLAERAGEFLSLPR